MKKYKYVYKITNLVNNKIYIGKHSTDDINDGYMGSGYRLKQAYKKYGLKNFNKEVIDYYTSEDELNQGEIYWIAQFNSTDLNIGYNLAYGGEGGAAHKGHHHTDETKRKISEALKGTQHSEEYKKKMSELMKGENHPMYGRHFHHSEATKQKMSQTRKGRPSPRKGKPMSEAAKQKMKGRIPWNKGKKLK